ncbi:MAG: hypothetical protein BRC27_02585 [Nanohaloarchaea archaeon SW_10_44_10]|nr:MAG: hypothetical protein BRC27_02585 [Nanohaloarchaea archaeon SW_10_44_10]
MQSNTTVLTLLFLTVLASGCIHSNEGTVTEGPESVDIQSIQVTPSEIYEGQNVRSSLTAYNAGNIEADVILGKNGEKMLTDYCPDIFENKEERFSAATSRVAETRKGEEASYNLKPGDKISVRWFLQQQGNVPLIGKRCQMSFSVPFNYSVEAYRQVQIKQDRSVEGSPNLQSESSSGPLTLTMETLPGSTGRPDTYIAEETGDERIQLLVQLINEKPQEEYRKGVVEIDRESFSIRATDPLDVDRSDCEFPDADFRMYQGKSVVIQCDIQVPQNFEEPSVLSDITAGIDYKYIKDGGTRTVEVKTRG